MDKTVTTFTKNAGEEVRAELSEYMGRQLVSLRVYYEGKDGKRRPGRKGLTLTVGLLPELVKAVHTLQAAAVEGGLIEAEEFMEAA